MTTLVKKMDQIDRSHPLQVHFAYVLGKVASILQHSNQATKVFSDIRNKYEIVKYDENLQLTLVIVLPIPTNILEVATCN